MADQNLPIGLIGGPEKRAIIIADYDPQWPAKYQEHARKIEQAAAGSALQIEHIGSTSVPGLGAKPVVDILLVVKDAANEADYLPSLETAGYVLRVREPDFDQHRMFRTPARDVHVHVFGVELRAGDRVRLWPQKKADIMDMALEGKVALIEAIEQDFEDNIQLAVVLDDDPGRDLGMMRQPGHRFFFSPHEVEPWKEAEKA